MPIIDIYNGDDYPKADDPNGTTKINGNLDLHTDSLDRNNVQVINVLTSNHELTFSGKINASLHQTCKDVPVPVRGYGILVYGSKVTFEKGLELSQISLNAHAASHHYLYGIKAEADEDSADYPTVINIGGEKSQLVISDMTLTAQSGPALLAALHSQGEIHIHGTTSISNLKATGISEGPEAYAFYADAGGIITADQNVSINGITAKGEESFAVALEAAGGTLDLKKGVVVTGIVAEDASAAEAFDGGKISINSSASNEKVIIEGNLFSQGTATEINANLMTTDSVFTGTTLWDADSEDFGTINLQFANGATWNVPETNTLHGTLTLKDGGLVVLGEDGASSLSRAAAPAPVELEVDNLEGTGGIFSLRVSTEQGITDHVTLNKATGSHQIRLRSTGTEPTHESLTNLVDEKEGDAAFSLEGGKVDMGLYSYKLDSYENDGMTTWKLVQADEAGGSGEDDPSGPNNPPKPELSKSAQAVLAMGSLGSQVTQHLNGLSDLRKRMGEVRGDTGTGLWVQAIDQKDRFNGFSGTGFKQRSYRFNFGVDHAIGNWIVGANFKHVTSDQKTRGNAAKGDSHDEGLNLYATYRAENGSYADFVLSADKNHQHLSTSMIDGTPVSGSYHNTGFGLSAEIGHQFVLNDAQQLFVEPQAELSYYMAKGADFTLTNGMKVSQKNYESLTGRLGAVFGKNFLDAQGHRIGQAAMHAGWKGELAGNNRITVNGVDFTDRLLKNRFYYGLNGNLAVTENLSLYGYVEREQGQGYTKEVEAGVGLKYRF